MDKLPSESHRRVWLAMGLLMASVPQLALAFFGGSCFLGELARLPIFLFGLPAVALGVWYGLDKKITRRGVRPLSRRAVVWRVLAAAVIALNLWLWIALLAEGCNISDIF